MSWARRPRTAFWSFNAIRSAYAGDKYTLFSVSGSPKGRRRQPLYCTLTPARQAILGRQTRNESRTTPLQAWYQDYSFRPEEHSSTGLHPWFPVVRDELQPAHAGGLAG